MENDSLSHRLDKLERRLTLWRALVVLLAILCAASIATNLRAAPTRIDTKAVFAQEFNLVNAAGRVTARFAPDPDDLNSPYLVLKYPNDKAAISIGVEGQSESVVTVLNNKGEPRAILHESTNGPSLSLFDEEKRLRVDVDAFTPGPQISLYDKARKRTVVAFSD
jgi:hypothetical protein